MENKNNNLDCRKTWDKQFKKVNTLLDNEILIPDIFKNVSIRPVNHFNKKWGKYLEAGHYGLDINHIKIIEYLDIEFKKEIVENPTFSYSQIKIKFGKARIYANSSKISIWQDYINNILNVHPHSVMNRT